jgi:hypothetical protein
LAQEVNAEEVDKMIEKIAKKVVDAGMETPAIITLQTSKPLSWIGGHMGRIMIAPWFGVLGWDAMHRADAYMALFEDRSNVEKLIQRIEELAGISDRSEKERKGQ